MAMANACLIRKKHLPPGEHQFNCAMENITLIEFFNDLNARDLRKTEEPNRVSLRGGKVYEIRLDSSEDQTP